MHVLTVTAASAKSPYSVIRTRDVIVACECVEKRTIVVCACAVGDEKMTLRHAAEVVFVHELAQLIFLAQPTEPVFAHKLIFVATAVTL